jgi:hypothetical protein
MTTSQAHMPYSIGTKREPGKRETIASVCYRLSRMYGEATSTWESRVYGENSVYRLAAKINRELIAAGLTEKVAELLAPIDASLMGEAVPPLHEAIVREQQGDRSEDGCQDAFLLALSEGAVPVAEAKEYVKRSAAARFRAEQCEAAVSLWVQAQEEK